MTDSASELERYLHEHIPISSAMQVKVRAASADQVRLWAPIEPNINHRNTVFGGSAAAVGILAGWALLHVRLRHGGQVSRIVIQRSTIDYRRPINDDFEAVAVTPDDSTWNRFVRMLARRGRARVDIDVDLSVGGSVVGSCHGTYVILPSEEGASASAKYV